MDDSNKGKVRRLNIEDMNSADKRPPNPASRRVP